MVFKQAKQGFTLIELLVVVLIIGILAAVALPQYQKAVTRARYMQLITVVESVLKAEESFYLANGTYTADASNLDVDFPQNTEEYKFELWKSESGNNFAITSNLEKSGLWYGAWGRNTTVPGRRECRVYGERPSYMYEICKSFSNSTYEQEGVVGFVWYQ